MDVDTNPISGMPVRAALQVIAEARNADAIVVTNQGSSRVWPLLANHPLDFHYNPSTMGGAIPFGLGLALADPTRSVIVVTGDGALTMSLGSLISVAAARAKNLTIIVLDNGIYEVTGGQRTGASLAQVNYARLAAAAGLTSTYGFADEVTWREQVHTVLASPGPRCVALRVAPAEEDDLLTSPEPMARQLARVSAELGRP
jgi:thiamine pyrophosphate-dependent acetolactate synthase large subunit-like protein